MNWKPGAILPSDEKYIYIEPKIDNLSIEAIVNAAKVLEELKDKEARSLIIESIRLFTRTTLSKEKL